MSRFATIVLLIVLLMFAGGCGEPQTSGEALSYKEVTPTELLSWIEEGRDLLLVDVREDHEYYDGHIPDSVLMPLGDLVENYWRLDRDKEIILICRSGRRSGLAAQFLSEEGYTEVYNMVGGMLEWQGPVKIVRPPFG